MKKLFLASVALTTFSISIAIFQISCKKEAKAESNNPTSGLAQINKIIFTKTLRNTDKTGSVEVWTANYDGTGQTKLNITLPDGLVFAEAVKPKLSPDGKTVFFSAGIPASTGAYYAYKAEIFSCSIDGSNLKKIVSGDNLSEVSGAY